MQFVAKDLLILDLPTLERNDTPNDFPPASVEERSLLASELAAESLRLSGSLRLRVRGESMLPSLWPGDVVEIAACSPDHLRPGEISLALRDGRFFLHRILGRSPAGGFFLRGDSMPAPDPEFPRSALLGKVAGSHPLRLWSWVLGRLFSRCGLALRLSLTLHARRIPTQNIPDATPLLSTAANPPAAPAQEFPLCPIPSPCLSELPHAGA